MSFLHRSPDLQRAHQRILRATDVSAVHDIIVRSTWVSLSIGQGELAHLTQEGLSIGLEQQRRLLGVAIVGWSMPPVAWIRGLVLHHDLRPTVALDHLLPAIEAHARQQGVQRLYTMSDQHDASWLRGALIKHGFVAQLDVVGYEKHTMAIPDWGNRDLTVRPATPADVPQIAQIDQAAFAPEWVKNDVILGGAFSVAPCYLVAEQAGQIIGYAFATSHRQGSVAHLVRIAVLPTLQHQAIGVRLLAEVVEWCRRHDVQIISLNTQTTNLHAQRLYQWFGFVRTNERQQVLACTIHTATHDS